MDGLGTNTPGLFEFWDGADKQTDFRLLGGCNKRPGYSVITRDSTPNRITVVFLMRSCTEHVSSTVFKRTVTVSFFSVRVLNSGRPNSNDWFLESVTSDSSEYYSLRATICLMVDTRVTLSPQLSGPCLTNFDEVLTYFPMASHGDEKRGSKC